MLFSFFIVLLAGISVGSVECLTCLDCTNIQSPRHCKYVMDCQQGEVCNVHRTTNRYGDAVFNVGCLHHSACSNRSHVNLACDECCSTDLCNAAGCGMAGYPTKRGPVCYTCPSQIIDGTCHQIEVCGINEVCMINEQSEFGDTVFTSQCVESTLCERHAIDISQLVGRSISDETRALAETVCRKCCHDDLCNAHCGATHTNRCAPNPCVLGKCVNNDTDFSCVCDPPYTGKLCSEKDDCVSNPCGRHGYCVNGSIGYTCVCNAPYTGQNCSEILAKDCQDLRNLTRTHISGVYTVHPDEIDEDVEVFCDMTTDGGGWTMFQRRVNGSVDFYQNFATYEKGFGDVHGEFWLGLKYTQAMTSNAKSELRIELVASDGSTAYEVFQNFSLSPAPNYTLHVDHGQGTAGDSSATGFSYHHSGHRFSTFDNDNSAIGTCAQWDHGGWWYYICASANLNGKYVTPGTTASDKNSGESGVIYRDFKHVESLKGTIMMFRRV